MNRLFLRIYLGITAVLVASVLVSVWIGSWFLERSMVDRIERTHVLSVRVIGDRIAAAGGDPGARRAGIDAASRDFGFPVRVVPLESLRLPRQKRERVEAGGAAVEIRGRRQPWVYGRVPGQSEAVVLGPLPSVGPIAEEGGIALLAGILVAIAAPVYLLVRGIELRLGTLASAADRFGRGDLEARARVRRDDEIGRLADSFNHMADRVGALLSGQQELLRAVSHELRTPIARLRFALELISLNEDAEDREKQIEEMDRDLVELDALVDELLTFARLQEGAPALEMQPVDGGKVLEEVREAAARLRPGVKVDLEAAVPEVEQPWLVANPRMLRRALSNLSVNAVRHARSRVSLSFRREGGTGVFRVDDDGPGVPLADRQRVFEPFVRLEDTRAPGIGGTGLGLAIVARVARGHGGTVEAGEAELGGARFTLRIPEKGPGDRFASGIMVARKERGRLEEG